MMFRMLWGIDALIAAVFGVFFVIGLNDGSVSSFNMLLWLAILAVLFGVLWGSHALRASGRTRMANGLLLLLAAPGVATGVMFLALIVMNPRWN